METTGPSEGYRVHILEAGAQCSEPWPAGTGAQLNMLQGTDCGRSEL